MLLQHLTHYKKLFLIQRITEYVKGQYILLPFSLHSKVSTQDKKSLRKYYVKSVLCYFSALEVFLNDMRYINSRFTYLLCSLGFLLVLKQSSIGEIEFATF